MKFHHISYGKQLTANKHKNQSKHRKSASRGRIALAPFAVMAVFAVAAIASPFVLSNNFARADSYDNQINALQNQNSDLNAQVSQLALQAGSIKAAIAALQNQQARLQTQIDASTAKIADLNNQIAAAEQQITQQSQAVVNALKNMYYDKQSSSTLNIIMNSNSVSDYVNAQARQTTIQNNLQKSIDKINELKQQLANKKAQVQTLLNSQQDQKKTLIASQAEQQSLENANQAQQTDFNNQVSANQQKMAQIQAAKDAFLRNQGIGSGNTSGRFSSGSVRYGNISNSHPCGYGGYSYCGVSVDPWALQGGQCVSWAAFRVSNGYGKYVAGFRGKGNAYEWVSSAPAYSGAQVVTDPQPGDVVIFPAGTFGSSVGHAAVVEPSVSSTPSGWVHVSQYNFNVSEGYSEMDVATSGVAFLRFHN